MRKWLNLYFYVSKRELNGVLVLILLIIAVSMAPRVCDWLFPEPADEAAERTALHQLTLVTAGTKSTAGAGLPKSTRRPVRRFRFDPNLAGMQEWQLLGLSEKQAAVLLRYRNKGGRFRRKEDLQRMYCISPALYRELEPFVRISAADTAAGTVRRYPPAALRERHPPVPLNSADTLLLDEVKGIGPAFARRIVRYRERLGGFFRKEQLLEVFGMDSVRFAMIRDQFSLDTSMLRPIRINKAEFDDLKGHPYLDFKQIKVILQFRKQHGNYTSFADLKKVAVLSPLTLEKLAPYISFEHD